MFHQSLIKIQLPWRVQQLHKTIYDRYISRFLLTLIVGLHNRKRIDIVPQYSHRLFIVCGNEIGKKNEEN